MSNFHIALISAMPEEIGNTLKHLNDVTSKKFGDLEIYSGKWNNKTNSTQTLCVSLAWSGWGKVSAARAATRLISNSSKDHPIDCIFFTGVAGAVDSNLKQWDVVIADKVVQYDMDARPLFKRFYIPALKLDRLISSEEWKKKTYSAILNAKNDGLLDEFGSITKGLIGTGDRFISDRNILVELSKDLDGLKAVEMEGAAVAQVASQEEIPWVIIRVISDEANSDAAQNFSEFLELYQKNSWYLISNIFDGIFLN
ncbi:5'-methylthioadenosine/adenosylhomocysteine nucleosidase [Prochlorococcus sp. MIT 1011]|uniref:5'-methylthioadenosine/adenosylhomocysteine nucleosidase n=1 Tax=Prochlorococcus sp. MIT 1011 TaxID=3082520 RepID=UPI0039B55524